MNDYLALTTTIQRRSTITNRALLCALGIHIFMIIMLLYTNNNDKNQLTVTAPPQPIFFTPATSTLTIPELPKNTHQLQKTSLTPAQVKHLEKTDHHATLSKPIIPIEYAPTPQRGSLPDVPDQTNTQEFDTVPNKAYAPEAEEPLEKNEEKSIRAHGAAAWSVHNTVRRIVEEQQDSSDAAEEPDTYTPIRGTHEHAQNHGKHGSLNANTANKKIAEKINKEFRIEKTNKIIRKIMQMIANEFNSHQQVFIFHQSESLLPAFFIRIDRHGHLLNFSFIAQSSVPEYNTLIEESVYKAQPYGTIPENQLDDDGTFSARICGPEDIRKGANALTLVLLETF
jgi:hypothetical protein